jgi:LPS export ABC transporter protein LptC
MSLYRPRNLLLLFALTIVVLLGAIVIWRYRPSTDLAELAKTLPQGVDLALEQINYTHAEGGVARWRLVAARVEHHSAEQVTALRDLQLTYFDANGDEQGTLTARNGQADADFAVIEVRDEVEVISRSGYTLQSERLTYHQADRSIRTDAPVRLTAAGLSLDGVGLHLDLASQRLRVLSAVRAELHPKR